jgi:hypothetical protein
LSLGRAPGKDGIHNEMLVNLDLNLKAKLLTVINMSWTSGTCPSGWLCGLIVPIHKPSKDKALMGSYRPVYLMSAVAKLAERLVCCTLHFDLESRNQLTLFQSGFQTGRSTSDPLLRLISDIQQGFNRPRPTEKTVAVLVDFSQAFDKVIHRKVILAMEERQLDPCYGR